MSSYRSEQEFGLTSNSLETGKMLIEASAGTGKTYSLTAIIVRLIIEKQIPIEEILVVTFTEAATAELKTRVRSAINALIKALNSNTKPTDSISELYWKPVPDDVVANAISRLTDALQSIDRASICTIHAFCASILKDNAFESGHLFGDEVITNEKELLEEVASDFWRKQFYPQEDKSYFEFLSIIGLNSVSGVMKTYNNWKRMDLHQVDPSAVVDFPDLSERYAQLKALSETFKEAVKRDYPELVSLVRDNHLSGNKYRQPRKEALLRLFEDTLVAEDPLSSIFHYCDSREGFKFITQENISAARCAKTNVNLGREAFRTGSQLQALYLEITDAFTSYLGPWIDHELTRQKQRRNVVSFDDMLKKAREAIESNSLLITSLREQFKVALIDEFQDTDSVQLKIFNSIFDTPTHRLYCVGDPKQSIYKFRGADIDTYLGTSRSDSGFSKFSLSTNYRSDEAIVEATNQLFLRRKDNENKFGDEGIEFHPCSVPDEKTGKRASRPAFILRCLGDHPSIISTARAVTAEIKRIRHEYTSYAFRSIAILVNSHDQAQAVGNACVKTGIPYIRKMDRSVYGSEAANILHTALSGILECHRIGKLKAALATPLFGRSMLELKRFDHDDTALNTELNTLYKIRHYWQETGFISAFSLISANESLRARLLALPGGDETLNNLLHLAELVHEHEQRNHAAPETLVKFLAEKREEENTDGTETSKLRRATDADAVVISTIHASKGLEYDAVVIPFAWSLPSNDDKDENTRKLYVATTRARETCTILVGKNASTHKTALGRILGQVDKHADICGLAKAFADASGGWLSYGNPLNDFDEDQDHSPRQLELATPPSKIRPGPIMTSFSSLSARLHQQPVSEALIDDKAAQYDDERDEQQPAAGLQETYLLLPAGAKTGRVFHGILEKIDFQDPQDHRREIVDNLNKEGFDAESLGQYLEDLVRKWLRSPLNKDGTARLSEIPGNKRINEMEFHFPLGEFPMQSIAAAIRPEEWPELEDKVAQLHSLAGFMKGFIDMVFEREGRYYIVDWKSNYLHEGYAQNSIRESMLNSLYPLQYLIYTVALDIYLQQCSIGYNYEAHFGGVYYVYLREFGTCPGHSVYFNKPRPETIRNLKACLLCANNREVME